MVLILGSHTCGNRGDSAIMRGLLDAIRQQAPEGGDGCDEPFPGEFRGCRAPDYCRPAVSVKPETAGGSRGLGQRSGEKYYAVVFSIKFYCLKSPGKDRCVILLSRRNLPNSRNCRSIFSPSFGGWFKLCRLMVLTHFEYPLCAFIANKQFIWWDASALSRSDFNQLANYVLDAPVLCICDENRQPRI